MGYTTSGSSDSSTPLAVATIGGTNRRASNEEIDLGPPSGEMTRRFSRPGEDPTSCVKERSAGSKPVESKQQRSAYGR
jgi:hypothetical protein